MIIKSFRGKLADGSIDTITLHTNTGSTGNKIVKFDIMPTVPNNAQISTVKIYKIPQTTPSVDVDFSDNTLLGAAMHQNNAASAYPWSGGIFFDNEIFNQDIYITHVDSDASAPINYYIELEQIKLDLNENTVATLKDIRNIASQ